MLVVIAEADSRIRNNCDETKEVLRALVRELRFMHERKEEIIPVMSRWLNQSQEVARDSYDSILSSFSLKGRTVNKTYEFGKSSRYTREASV